MHYTLYTIHYTVYNILRKQKIKITTKKYSPLGAHSMIAKRDFTFHGSYFVA